MKSRSRHQAGQILVVSALLLPVLLAMAGLAIDVGTYASNRRSLQNAADGAALAGGQELPNTTAATTKALEYTSQHGIDPSDVTVSVTGGTTEPRLRVTIDRTHDFSFMAVVGIGSRNVGAGAVAGKFSYGGGSGVVPWSVTQDMVNSAESGDEVIVKYDAGSNPGNGHFGAIRIDGNGDSDYEDSGRYGATATICSEGMDHCGASDCPGAFPTSCAEDSGECDGHACDPKTGNMTGSTRDIVDFRKDYTKSECDTFGEAFKPHGAFTEFDGEPDAELVKSYSSGGRLAAPDPHHGSGGHSTYTPTATPTRTRTPTATHTAAPSSTPVPSSTPAGATNTPAPTNTAGPTNTPAPTSTPATGGQVYGIDPDCNPWTGGACASTTSSCSRRIFLIPIIEQYTDPYEIVGFALVFLEGYEGSCSGSSCDVKVRFVKSNATLDGVFTGTYNNNVYNHFVKLVE